MQNYRMTNLIGYLQQELNHIGGIGEYLYLYNPKN